MNPNQSWLNLNGRLYTSEQLKSGVDKNNLNPFEESTLQFCREWLNGKSEFQLQTSGSTGIPKQITITRRQMEVSANLTIRALNLKPNYTSLVCLDTKYIAGQMMLVRSFLLGMNIIAVDPSSNPFEKIPLHQQIDFSALVPYQVQAILKSPSRLRFSDLTCAIIGGAPLDLSTRQEIQAIKCQLFATYGMTETISHIALQRLNGEHSQDYFEVMNEIEIATDERGCLTIQANYLGSERISTNDLVEIVSDKKFRWLGRWDNVINSGAVKVMPENVERAVEGIFDSMKITNRFFVAGLPDTKLGQKVTLVIEGIPFPDELTRKIKNLIEEKVSLYNRPGDIKFIGNFKETATGKVMRKETLNLVPARSH